MERRKIGQSYLSDEPSESPEESKVPSASKEQAYVDIISRG